jgi:hypothetical protein
VDQGIIVGIWVEDLGALYPVTEFARLPLTVKVHTMADLVRPSLLDRPHVAGVMVSTAARQRYPLPPDEQVNEFAGMGLKRGLPIDHMRETVIVTKDLFLLGPDAFRVAGLRAGAALARLGAGPAGVCWRS